MEAYSTSEQQCQNSGLEATGGDYWFFDVHIFYVK